MKLKKRIALLCALAFGASGMAMTGSVFAQSTDEMKRQIDELQRQLQMLKERMDQMSQQQKAPPPAQASQATPAPSGSGHGFLERKEDDGITFYTRGGEVSVYGTLDVSVDTSTKGISGMNTGGAPPFNTPVGNGGWQPAISSNLSYVGVRGFQTLGDRPTRFVYQLETQIDISATPGSTNTNSNQSTAVKGALVSRNSFIGFASPTWGALKIGKTDAPYKTSTSRMNEFSGMPGDYSVIMGNTGGDNRVEFGTRLSHAIWYESPKWGGVSFNALFAPGQNRANDSSNIAAGEPECAGGNLPGSGNLPFGAALSPGSCSDGAFSNAWSGSLSYDQGPLYLTGAYEMHKKVNRTGDLVGVVTPFSTAAGFDPNDVADERAWKIGLQYRFPTKTTFSFAWENMKRNVPAYLQVQNERQRTGFWLALSQTITPDDSFHLGWAHANRTPGDPGSHNPPAAATVDPTLGFGFSHADNRANMYTLAWKHKMDKNFTLYANYATTVNHTFAHYDLGAGGRSVTTDCHDASNPDVSGFDPNGGSPRCWAGARLQAFSLGLNYKF